MTTTTSNSNAEQTRELVITRTFDAPRNLVYKAWTDPAQLAKWFGPNQFTIPVCELDVRPGGAILIHIMSPEGDVYPMKGEFREVEPPERLVFTSAAYASVDGPLLLEDRTTVTLAEDNGKTTLTMHAVVTKATPGAEGALAGMEQGWNETLDKLADHLAKI